MDMVTITNAFIAPVMQLMKLVIEEDENREILQTDWTPINNLLLDINILFQDQRKEAQDALKIWMQLLQNSFTEARSLLHRSKQQRQRRHRQRCLDLLICNPRPLSQEIKEWKVLFDYLFQALQTDFSIFVTAHQVLHRDPIPAMSAEMSAQPLSKDEAWLLFRRIAFKDNDVSMDVEEYAKIFAEECKGWPLAITLVAAAMKGKTRVDEWENSLFSLKTADPSFPDTDLHPRFDPQLYQRFRWSYDALPNSNIKICFLYCALYQEDDQISVEDLVQMWIAEGLVRSKQGNHLMDMAIGLSYINLLVDRCLFQNVQIKDFWPYAWKRQNIRVEHVIRDMAIYIGEKEDHCLFRAGQQLENFPENIQNEYCKRISVSNNDIENLPTEFTCPKLVSLFLSENSQIEEVPSGFLVSLTSLKVLNLSRNDRISSIPSSVGQLKQLEFLELSDLKIEDLPEEICHLSSLQFLDLTNCRSLKSLPSQIGELQNLRYLNLFQCSSLRVIPHEISQLTSLSTLLTYRDLVSMEADSEASIWSLKGLRNLTMLSLGLKLDVQEGIMSPGIKVGIMGTWLEMRHLWLDCRVYGDLVMDNFPHDMQNMSKLQSFIMRGYHELRLPDYTCKFQHLEYLILDGCPHLTELSPLERLPNLKTLKLINWPNLKQLGIGNSDSSRGFVMLEKLVMMDLPKLESIAGASNSGVWNERTVPRLRILKILECPNLRRLPVGIKKLLNLSKISGEESWWQTIIWEDHNIKMYLENLFIKW